MAVDSELLATLRDMTPENDFSGLRSLCKTGFTIGAIVELACVRKHCISPVQALLNQWEKSSPLLREAITIFEATQYPHRNNMWSARTHEFFPVIGENWADKLKYHPFESRFYKAAKAAGFGDMADALTGALFEMADNVVQHSGIGLANAAPGLIGYYTDTRLNRSAAATSLSAALATRLSNPGAEIKRTFLN